MIKKLNHRYYIYNHTGEKRIDKKEGFTTEKAAKKRLRQIEYFKYIGGK